MLQHFNMVLEVLPFLGGFSCSLQLLHFINCHDEVTTIQSISEVIQHFPKILCILIEIPHSCICFRCVATEYFQRQTTWNENKGSGACCSSHHIITGDFFFSFVQPPKKVFFYHPPLFSTILNLISQKFENWLALSTGQESLLANTEQVKVSVCQDNFVMMTMQCCTVHCIDILYMTNLECSSNIPITTVSIYIIYNKKLHQEFLSAFLSQENVITGQLQ